MMLVALVDYHNDVIGDALTVANEFGKDLYVQVDTQGKWSIFHPSPRAWDRLIRSVNVTLTKALRDALDEAGHADVKIIVWRFYCG